MSGGHLTKVSVGVVSQGRTNTMPTGEKRMETGVPEESGDFRVMKRGAKVKNGIIHEEIMYNKGNPGKIVFLAVIQVVLIDNLLYFHVSCLYLLMLVNLLRWRVFLIFSVFQFWLQPDI
jgi:hypothetical protein